MDYGLQKLNILEPSTISSALSGHSPILISSLVLTLLLSYCPNVYDVIYYTIL